MTPEGQLIGFIDNADEPGIVALLAPLDEPARAALLPVVEEQVHEQKRRYDDSAPGLDKHARVHAAFLAWLGVADLDGLPPPVKHDPDHMRWFLHRACASDRGHQILFDRRPAWLAELANQHLAYGHWMWDPVWRLVLDGLIDRPATHDYLRGVAEYVGRSGDLPLDEMVRRDPALLGHDLQALLDLPGGAGMLARGDMRRSGLGRDRTVTRVWSPLLAALPPGDPLRDRLLTELLTALGGDLGKEASTYHSFLTALRPSASEYAVRQQALLRLAGHRQSAVVSFAVAALSKVDKRHVIAPRDVVDHLGNATGAASAATACAAIRLIGSAAKRQPEPRRRRSGCARARAEPPTTRDPTRRSHPAGSLRRR